LVTLSPMVGLVAMLTKHCLALPTLAFHNLAQPTKTQGYHGYHGYLSSIGCLGYHGCHVYLCYSVWSGAFTASRYNKISLGYQTRQVVEWRKNQRFEDGDGPRNVVFLPFNHLTRLVPWEDFIIFGTVVTLVTELTHTARHRHGQPFLCFSCTLCVAHVNFCNIVQPHVIKNISLILEYMHCLYYRCLAVTTTAVILMKSKARTLLTDRHVEEMYANQNIN
jgi:hypothetical protein